MKSITRVRRVQAIQIVSGSYGTGMSGAVLKALTVSVCKFE